MSTNSLAHGRMQSPLVFREDRVARVGATSGAKPRFGGMSMHRRLVMSSLLSLLSLSPAALTGCSSGDSPQGDATAPAAKATSESPAQPAAAVPTHENQPTATDAPMTSASQEPSPQEQAARTAFRTMTSPAVSTQEWEAAHQKLQEIGEPALPVLVEGLQDKQTFKREMASTVLALFGPAAEPVAEQLIAALGDESVFVRANVAAALLQMPEHVERVVPVLAEFLAGDDVELRRMAATNLAAVDAEQARPLMPQLITALDDSDREVVYYCVQLLGRMGPDAEAALPKLRALQTEGDAELKSAVSTAILQIEPETAPES
jgi:hypothetical protein